MDHLEVGKVEIGKLEREKIGETEVGKEKSVKIGKAERGKFIVFEGIDGSGKSTQIQMLADKLRSRNISCYVTMEPTDSPIGAMIHQVMTRRMQADAKVVAALFVADRLDHLLNEVNGICKMVAEGTTVLMDRYYFSSYAYQSVEVPMEWLIQANTLSSATLRPDVNLFLDISPQAAMERIRSGRFQTELYEETSRLVQVRQNYLDAFDRLKGVEEVARIDAGRSRKEVAADVWHVVEGLFKG